MRLQDRSQFVLEFLWREINSRNLVSPHDFIEIPAVELEQLGGLALRNDMLA